MKEVTPREIRGMPTDKLYVTSAAFSSPLVPPMATENSPTNTQSSDNNSFRSPFLVTAAPDVFNSPSVKCSKSFEASRRRPSPFPSAVERSYKRPKFNCSDLPDSGSSSPPEFDMTSPTSVSTSLSSAPLSPIQSPTLEDSETRSGSPHLDSDGNLSIFSSSPDSELLPKMKFESSLMEKDDAKVPSSTAVDSLEVPEFDVKPQRPVSAVLQSQLDSLPESSVDQISSPDIDTSSLSGGAEDWPPVCAEAPALLPSPIANSPASKINPLSEQGTTDGGGSALSGAITALPDQCLCTADLSSSVWPASEAVGVDNTEYDEAKVDLTESSTEVEKVEGSVEDSHSISAKGER